MENIMSGNPTDQSNKIFVVTSGEYSDYHIEAVFSSKELALGYIKQQFDDIDNWYSKRHYVEEYDIDATKVEPFDKELYWVKVFSDCTGEALKAEGGYLINHFAIWNDLTTKDIVLHLFVFAKDEIHARKIGSEFHTKIMATRGWPTLAELHEKTRGQNLDLAEWLANESV